MECHKRFRRSGSVHRNKKMGEGFRQPASIRHETDRKASVITLTFEAKKFRGQIGGKTDRVESSEREFLGSFAVSTLSPFQPTLYAEGTGRARSLASSSICHSPWRQDLREALTGVRAKETETAPIRPVQASVQAKCSPRFGLPARLSKGTPPPLCQPLKLAVGLPTICQYGSFAHCCFTVPARHNLAICSGGRCLIM
jgi:hypothetical protein